MTEGSSRVSIHLLSEPFHLKTSFKVQFLKTFGAIAQELDGSDSLMPYEGSGTGSTWTDWIPTDSWGTCSWGHDDSGDEGEEEQQGVMVKLLLRLRPPGEKGEAKRADGEKPAAPRFPVCVDLGRTERSQHSAASCVQPAARMIL